MNPPPAPTLREATLDDLPAIAALRESVGWGVQEWALRAVVGQPDARCVVAMTPGGDVAAVGSGIVYGPLGFVGNMIVGEEHRRRGLGSAVLRDIIGFLEAAGCVRLELNATSSGRPLYEQHGFASIGTSQVATISRNPKPAHHPAIAIRQATRDDLDAIASYDLPRFGGDRRRLLSGFLDDATAPTLLAEQDGALVGYGTLRVDGGRMGPLLADEPSVAGTLIAEGFARAPDAEGLRVSLPPGNRRGAEWLRSLNADLEPWDGRMARGAELPKREETLYGMAVGALG